MKRYTVFVDGVEVNDYYLTLADAKAVYRAYLLDGYDPYIHRAVLDRTGQVKKYVHIPQKSDRYQNKLSQKHATSV